MGLNNIEIINKPDEFKFKINGNEIHGVTKYEIKSEFELNKINIELIIGKLEINKNEDKT